MTKIYQVSIPNTLRDFFDYLPAALPVQPGCRVLVSFRGKECIGLVIGEGTSSLPVEKLKPILAIIDEEPLLDGHILDLARWVSHYYQSYFAQIITLVLPKKARRVSTGMRRTEPHYLLALPIAQITQQLPKAARKQRALAEFLAQSNEPTSIETIQAAGFNRQNLSALVASNYVICREPAPPHYELQAPLNLNTEQDEAVSLIRQHLHHYQCFLLQGVTGSGKTEVYLHLTAQVLAAGKQVLILVPEIGLTPQFIARLQQRFNEPMAIIHSALNETERFLAWESARKNKIRLILGTRAAVFTPLPLLGLIIIDEEHDTSLKQMEGARYSARDTAIVRAQFCNIPIILGSATPSLESIYNCQQQKYQRLYLTQKAMTAQPLFYNIVDLRNGNLQHGLAGLTLQRISEHLQRGNQVLVFINRRGFSPVLLCHQCGWMADCRACDSHLTWHRLANQLICHHCGFAVARPQHCSNCRSKELIPVGVGTQRLHEFLRDYFPETAILRIDRDEVGKKDAFAQRLELINNGSAQLIVGTQMLAKGHHFPNLTLAVIVDGDSGFYSPDFRASEQLGQLLVQVSGRAGRAQKAGEVIIQTHAPDQPLLKTLVQQGYDVFAENLLTLRHQTGLPPYYFLAALHAQGRHEDVLKRALMQMKHFLQNFQVSILGPAPATLARKANYYRMQILIKAPQRKYIQTALTALREWITINKLFTNIRWTIDVDPLDLA